MSEPLTMSAEREAIHRRITAYAPIVETFAELDATRNELEIVTRDRDSWKSQSQTHNIDLISERAAHKRTQEESARHYFKTQEQLTKANSTWRCFHCGFETNDQAEAQAHFGDRDDAAEFTPTCTWWSKLSTEERAEEIQNLRRQITAEQDDNGNLRQKIEGLEYRLEGQLSEIHSFKPFRNCDSIHKVFHIYDSIEGRALLAEEQLRHSREVSTELLSALKILASHHEDCYCDDDDGLTGKCLHCIITAAIALAYRDVQDTSCCCGHSKEAHEGHTYQPPNGVPTHCAMGCGCQFYRPVERNAIKESA